MSSDLPPTRWEGPSDIGRGYGRHFAELIAGGADVEGEARLADALAPRGARILDVLIRKTQANPGMSIDEFMNSERQFMLDFKSMVAELHL